MIDRYSREIMKKIWSPENRFEKWLKIEISACEALAQLGLIPKKSLKNIKAKAAFDVQRIDEIEKVTRHDVIAFTTCVGEYVGADARYIHWGLTSSDVLDTSLSILLKEAAAIILQDIDELLKVLKARALEHKDTVMIGRTHGIHAEPITFGLKLALWYDEIKRHRQRMAAAQEGISYGKISGAVGTYAYIPPFVEQYVCEQCGLQPAPIATQILQRDLHSQYFSTLALIGSTLEKFAVEIRHLQRTEVSEAAEFFSPGQKGSSAMPHKKNPILSENVSGLARILRANALAAMENIALWHERDISHSSVERIIAPDSTTLLDFMLVRFTSLIKDLEVYPENMKANLEKTRGLFFSQRIMLELTKKGLSREKAYRLVQKCALSAWENGKDFKDTLSHAKAITEVLSPEDLEQYFRLDFFLKHTDEIFSRVFTEHSEP